MKKTEEELQKRTEEGLEVNGHPLDVQAYREVFRRMNHKPEVHLSADFADRVVAQVLEKRRRRESRDYVWFGIGIALLSITFAAAVVMTGFKVQFGFLRGISPYAGIFIFGVIFILFLNRLDKKLLARKKE